MFELTLKLEERLKTISIHEWPFMSLAVMTGLVMIHKSASVMVMFVSGECNMLLMARVAAVMVVTTAAAALVVVSG